MDEKNRLQMFQTVILNWFSQYLIASYFPKIELQFCSHPAAVWLLFFEVLHALRYA